MGKTLREKLINLNDWAAHYDAIYDKGLTEAVNALEVRRRIEGRILMLVNLSRLGEWRTGRS